VDFYGFFIKILEGICRNLNWFQKWTQVDVGDSKGVRFWIDIWACDTHLKLLCPKLFVNGWTHMNQWTLKEVA